MEYLMIFGLGGVTVLWLVGSLVSYVRQERMATRMVEVDIEDDV